MKRIRFKGKLALVLALSLLMVMYLWGPSDHIASGDSQTYQNLKVFTEILSLIEGNYVDEVKSGELMEGAIKGMLKTLDPHTSYMPPDVYKEMQVETEGSFGGLGIEITIRDGVPTVISPIEDTPAYRAGIKTGDRIIKVDGQETKDMTLFEAVKRMRGPKGTTVTITIIRDQFTEPKDFTLVRDIIKVKSVRHRLIDESIGYVKIRTFNKNTSEELKEALKELELKNIKGLVLDLRGNAGGLLDQAVNVSDLFLEGGKVIVSTQGRLKNQNMRFNSHTKESQRMYPMVVLVNKGSASASEIVAGAMQDYKRAVILGEQTFGKGSVQTIIPLSDGSGLRLTTAKYYTPSGKVIQGKGIMPDIIVEGEQTTAQKTEEQKPHPTISETNEKVKEKEVEAPPQSEEESLAKDHQLRRAVEILKSWEILKNLVPTKNAG